MITDAQVLELVEAIAGDEAMLFPVFPVLPDWYYALNEAEKDELQARGELITRARLRVAIDRLNDKK